MTRYLDDGDVRLYHGDAAGVLAGLPDASVDCVVTSPPYFGLRDYGYPGQIGLEDTPQAFIERLAGVFREVRRVLAPHGTCWVNMGDSYATGTNADRNPTTTTGADVPASWSNRSQSVRRSPAGFKPKDLLGIPWRLAFALQDDGWWLRSDVIWAKPNPMPESVTDRPTKAHEYLFLLTKRPRYYWDAEGVREPIKPESAARYDYAFGGAKTAEMQERERRGEMGGRTRPEGMREPTNGRNVRSVWTFPTEPNPEAHFATFPRELVRRCLAAGCPERVCRTCGKPSERIVERTSHQAQEHWSGTDRGNGVAAGGGHVGRTGTWSVEARTVGWTDCGHDDYRPGVVLDPFIGSGTTAVVARAIGRGCVGIDGSAEYLEIAARRTRQLSLLGGAA